MTDKFHQGDVQLLIVVSAPDGVDSAAARATGTQIVDQLRQSPHVANVTSPWTTPPAAAADLVSRDRTAGLIVAGITGSESQQQTYAKDLSEQVARDGGDVTVRSGGIAMVNVQITDQSQRDLLLMESIAIPLSFLVLVWVFGGLLAAALPVAVGGMAILGALAVLRIISFTTDVSIFALNLTTAMGLALAIDYTLLMISRYRDELAEGASREVALIANDVVGRANRRVLRHHGGAVDGGAGAVSDALPEVVRIRRGRHRRIRRHRRHRGDTRGSGPDRRPPGFAGRRAGSLGVCSAGPSRRRPRRAKVLVSHAPNASCAAPFRVGLAGVALLLLLGAPFLGVRWGFPDDRVLPKTASAHQVGDQLRQDFANNSDTAVTVVVPEHRRPQPERHRRLRRQLVSGARRFGRVRPDGHIRCGQPRRTSVRADRPGLRQRIPHRREHRSAVLRSFGGASSTTCTRCRPRRASRST